MQLDAQRRSPRIPAPRSPIDVSSPAAAEALVDSLRRTLVVSYVPLCDAVARLDTSAAEWVLYLDSDSPSEDHCWAMLDVLRVLADGLDAATSASRSTRLHLIAVTAHPE